MQVEIDVQMHQRYTGCMRVKFYLSTIVTSVWPLDRQERLLAAWLAESPCEPVRYVDDKIGPKARRTANAKALIERAAMLRPTSRQEPELIVTASWRNFAFGSDDLAGAIAAAAARQATLIALDRHVRIEPNATGQTVAAEIAEFGRMVRNRVTGRTKAEIAEEVEIATKERIAQIAPDWPKPEPSTPELLLKAGPRPGKKMAYATAVKYLGKRPEAKHAYQMEQNRQAGRDAGARPGRKPKG